MLACTLGAYLVRSRLGLGELRRPARLADLLVDGRRIIRRPLARKKEQKCFAEKDAYILVLAVG